MSESPHKAAAFPRCHLPFKLIVTVQRTSLKGGDKVESSDIRMDGDTRAGCAHLGWMRVDDAQRGRALHLSIALLQITCRRSTSHMFSNNHVFFLMLYCGVDVLTMSAQELQLHKCSERRLSFRSPKVGTIVTNDAERPTSVQH